MSATRVAASLDLRRLELVERAEQAIGEDLCLEALGLTTRRLGQCDLDPETETRLRVVRARALWSTGRVAAARAELKRAARRAMSPLSRGRVAEARARFGWRAQELENAEKHLVDARTCYRDSGVESADLALLDIECGLLRDSGRVELALTLAERRAERASRAGDLPGEIRARHDRGSLLLALGRWQDARVELTRAGDLLLGTKDPVGTALIGVTRAVLELACGDLSAAHLLLRGSESALLGRQDPRLRGELLLSWADFHQTAGDPAHADQSASEALVQFRAVVDPAGESRARVRRCHALLDLDRRAEAIREARRALALSERSDLQALALISLGRALLRTRPDMAASVFERAVGLGDDRSGCAHAARLGRAVARGGDPQEVRLALAGLEMWGDRRIVAFAVADLKRLSCVPGFHSSCPGRVRRSEDDPAQRSPQWLEAATLLAGDGAWENRWSAAMRALSPVLPWWRTAFIGDGVAHELRGDLEMPVPLAETALARQVGKSVTLPAVIDLRDAAFRWHPERVFHDLGSAVVVPVGNRGMLYLDRRDDHTPFESTDLVMAGQFGRLLSCHVLPGEDAAPPPRFPGIVGRSPAMDALFKQMAQVARSESWVHVFGETGTGKELVARAIHEHSARRHQRFVPINASSLSDERFESEMFGHRKGSFTGAITDREGYAQLAQGGTLFIDEVTDLSLRVQAKLLRFLTDLEYRRMGETDLRHADLRIITASNVRLRDRVTAGTFREDLMFRLDDLVLEIPPLRDRGDDVLILARHFLACSATRDRVAVPALPQAVARRLRAYKWPGNVRELSREMARLLVFSGGCPLRAEQLSEGIARPNTSANGTLRLACRTFERGYIAEVLERHARCRTETALALGLTRQGLVAKLRNLGL